MKKFLMGGLFLLTTSFLLAQTNIDNVINIKEVERIRGIRVKDGHDLIDVTLKDAANTPALNVVGLR